MTWEAHTLAEFKQALIEAKDADRTSVIVVHTDPTLRVPGYDSWWDVAVAEVSEIEAVRQARATMRRCKRESVTIFPQ